VFDLEAQMQGRSNIKWGLKRILIWDLIWFFSPNINIARNNFLVKYSARKKNVKFIFT
jgi:hypothetical protein